jgi:hypothetical protein
VSNEVRIRVKLDKKGGYKGQVVFHALRNPDFFLTLVKNRKSAVKKALAGILPGAKMTGYKLMTLASNDVLVSVGFTGHWTKTNGTYRLSIPAPFKGLAALLSAEGPVRVSGPECGSIVFELSYPKKWRVVIAKEQMERSCGVGAFDYKVDVKKGHLVLRSRFDLSRPFVKASELGPLHGVIRAALAPALWQVLIPTPE